VGCFDPEIGTVMLSFIFDCWTFWRHLVTSGNLVCNSFPSVLYFQNKKYRKPGLFLVSASFSVLLGLHAPALCTVQEICWALFCPEGHAKRTSSLKLKEFQSEVLLLHDAVCHS